MDKKLKTKIRKHLMKVRTRYSVKAQDPSLAGYCAICSYHIWKLLTRIKLEPEFRLKPSLWLSHCYVTCGSYLIDITAKQFGNKFPNVSFRKIRDYDFWFWRKDAYKAKTVKEIQDLLDEIGWVDYQRPKAMKKRKKKRTRK